MRTPLNSDGYATIPEEHNFEEVISHVCADIHDRITANVEQKFLLQDEHYFQAELYHGLIPQINRLNPHLEVRLEHKPHLLRHGHVDISIIDQSEPIEKDLLYITVARRTKKSKDSFADDILKMATLSRRATSIVILVADGKEMADLRVQNNFLLDKKRKIVFKENLDEILAAQDDFEFFMEKLTKKLDLNESVPEQFHMELINSFYFGTREKQRFAITMWRIDHEPEIDDQRSGSTFMTEISGNGRTQYRFKNRLRASREFDMRGESMVYVISELILKTDIVTDCDECSTAQSLN